MNLLNQPHTVFKDRQAAEKVTADLDADEFTILDDPRGSGRCIVALLDAEDRSVCCYL